jgi:hypothetical protein
MRLLLCRGLVAFVEKEQAKDPYRYRSCRRYKARDAGTASETHLVFPYVILEFLYTWDFLDTYVESNEILVWLLRKFLTSEVCGESVHTIDVESHLLVWANLELPKMLVGI